MMKQITLTLLTLQAAHASQKIIITPQTYTINLSQLPPLATPKKSTTSDDQLLRLVIDALTALRDAINAFNFLAIGITGASTPFLNYDINALPNIATIPTTPAPSDTTKKELNNAFATITSAFTQLQTKISTFNKAVMTQTSQV